MPRTLVPALVLAFASLAVPACANAIYDNDLSPDDPMANAYAPTTSATVPAGSASFAPGAPRPTPTPAPTPSPRPASQRSTAIDLGPAQTNPRAVARWDFEPASADCNGWNATGATAIRAVPSHSGAYACKLCSDGSSTEMKLTRRVAGLPKGRWLVSAWMRRHSADPSAVALAARVTLDELDELAPGAPAAGLVTIDLDEEWRLLGDPVYVVSDLASTTVSIIANAAAGECLLVDDVVVESAKADDAQAPPAEAASTR